VHFEITNECTQPARKRQEFTKNCWKFNNQKINIQSFSMTIEAEVACKSHRIHKKTKLDALDRALWIWFCQEKQKGTPVSGPIIKEMFNLIRKMGR
jgi:hypothetical protein